MAIVINATQETITLRLRSHYFTWKPAQKKVIRDEELAHFIRTERGDSGLAVISELVRDDEEISPEELEERRAASAEAEKLECEAALDRYVQKHRRVIENNQISLRRDLEQSGIKADPAVFASTGELESMKLVAKYQKSAEDKEQAKVEEVRRLMSNVKGK
jgi:hypothetical protein